MNKPGIPKGPLNQHKAMAMGRMPKVAGAKAPAKPKPAAKGGK